MFDLLQPLKSISDLTNSYFVCKYVFYHTVDVYIDDWNETSHLNRWFKSEGLKS